jgi:DNA-binding response OmpR family regulator
MTYIALRSSVVAAEMPRRRLQRGRPSNAASTAGVVRLALCGCCASHLRAALRSGSQTGVLISEDGGAIVHVRLDVDDAQPSTYESRNGFIVVNWVERIISTDAGRQVLSPTGMRLFATLLQAGGNVVSRLALIRGAWPSIGEKELDRNNDLAVHICGLRKRLTAIGLADALQTVRGAGYRLQL